MAEKRLCRNCHKDIGDAEFCPYCGEYRLGNKVLQRKNEALARYKQTAIINNIGQTSKKEKQPIFTEEEAFLMGIHPQDAFFRKTMELDILGKDYDE